MLMARAGLSPVMIGRDGPLGGLLELASTPEPATVLVAGEAGIGKSRLVRELLTRLPTDTFVLAGQAEPDGLARPFEWLYEAVGPHVNPDDPRWEKVRKPAIHPSDATATIGPAEAQVALHRRQAALELVDDLIADHPVVAVFEDLHWADADSATLFERLAESGRPRLTVIGTYRSEELSRRSPLATIIARLDRRVGATHLSLDPLSLDQTAAFLEAITGQPPSYRAAKALRTRTGGNPFFLEELLSAHRDCDPEALIDTPLPWTLAEAVRAQVDELTPLDRQVVETTAVLGRRVPFDLLAEVSGMEEPALIASLRRLIDEGVIVEAQSDTFSFRHALAREAIQDRLLGREKRRLHQAALDAHKRLGDVDAAELAHHAQGAGDYQLMVRLARDGARAALRTGSSFRALQLAELGLTEAPEDLALRCWATQAAWLSGLDSDAIAHSEAWRDAARRAASLADEAEAEMKLIRLTWETGRDDEHREAVARLEALLDQLGDTATHAWALATLAQEAMLAMRGDADAIAWARRAIEMARRLDLADVELAAEVEQGSAMLTNDERADEGRDRLMSVIERAIPGQPEHDLFAARARFNLFWCERWFRWLDFPTQAVLLEDMKRAGERAGFESMATTGYANSRAELAYRQGDLAGVERWALESLRLGRSWQGQGAGQLYSLDVCDRLLDAGAVDKAAEVLASAAGAEWPSVRLRWATVAVSRGDVDGALSVIRETVDQRGADQWTIDVLRLLVPLILHAGGGPAAIEPLVEAALATRPSASPMRRLWTACFSTQLRLAAGDATATLAAAQPLLEADRPDQPPGARPWRGKGPELGTFYVTVARAHLALGETDAARDAVERAGELLERWGGFRKEQLDALQRRLAPRSGPGRAPEALTRREREVVDLLAEGLSNAELAERLYISPKTAAVHVSNILAKLGFSSRAEVAAWAVRGGLVESGR